MSSTIVESDFQPSEMYPYYLMTTNTINKYLKKRLGKHFVGTFPRDKAPQVKSKLDKLDESYAVFNLDDSQGEGSHWVALGKQTTSSGEPIYLYFDPFGSVPFLEITKNYSPLFYSPHIIQNMNTALCGLYVTKWIIKMSEDDVPDSFFKEYH